ncbi:MAG: hypothetical protein IAG13_20705, partial [Deltaproteobacteria bacterium]|nr:hypothetical protein [Nannocystaceae bacterium]
MLGGFDPRSEKLFFQRRRGVSLAISLLLYGGAIAFAVTRGPGEQVVEVELEPELKDFAVEDEPEPEMDEPPPPPPPNAKVDVNKKPQKKKKIEPPTAKPQEAAAETTAEKTYAPSGASDGAGSAQTDKP